MNKKNLPGKKGNKADKVQASESDLRLSKAQLLSVIEFSRQFPELTQHLAVVRGTDSEAAKQGSSEESSSEPLEFPPLVAPDPREIKPRVSEDSCEEPEHSASEDEFALFAAGRLPPPEPAGRQKKKRKIWKLLLPLTMFLLFLFWLHEAASPGRPVNSTQQRKLQASK
ncbi:hypothetical protein GCAAIG_05860 [Candidatus Electronema halotolerans]|jgi:hypothetical protein